ncbi:DUF4262 domain-containing protein [Streptomyces sp. NPDC047072]|uniref:DUF4262 domain-containing protein n=1 Tax=Streptomyces sp. NPDC047072 TaxID=3154809 RepID=UPI0034100772
MSSYDYDQLAAYVLRARQLIAKHGYTVQPVVTDGRSAPYSYTVGLHTTHGYELVMVGIDNPVMNGVLHALVERFTGSAGPDPDERLDGLLANGYQLRMAPVPSLEPFSLLRAVYGPDACPPFWQAIWPDPAGHFPDEAGYSLPRKQQMLP